MRIVARTSELQNGGRCISRCAFLYFIHSYKVGGDHEINGLALYSVSVIHHDSKQ
jgi:hypothetical protein